MFCRPWAKRSKADFATTSGVFVAFDAKSNNLRTLIAMPLKMALPPE